jgi:hypothetical protein
VFTNAFLRGSTFSADKLGIWASALCVLHCVVTPVLASMSVLLARLVPGGGANASCAGCGNRGTGGDCADARVSDPQAAANSWANGARVEPYLCRGVLGRTIAFT